MIGQISHWFQLTVIALSTVCIIAEVRRAWRIIPPAMQVPIGWRNGETVWEWPKPIALTIVAASHLAWNAFLALMALSGPPYPQDVIAAFVALGLSVGSVVTTTVTLRTGIAQLRKQGRRLRE